MALSHKNCQLNLSQTWNPSICYMVPIWCQALLLFCCVLLHVCRPQITTVFLFFHNSRIQRKPAPLTEVLKAKAGDVYDLDCKQDVSFLVRESFTPKRPAWAEDDDFQKHVAGKTPWFFWAPECLFGVVLGWSEEAMYLHSIQ